MPDLHQWITMKVDAVERDTEQAHTRYRVFATLGTGLISGYQQATAPEAILRRCEADRRILARHTADPTSYDYPACEGCGTTGEYDWPVTDNINDCPELLDLAHAHGISEEELAALDRPQPPQRPPARPDPVRPRMHTADVPAALRGPNWQPHQ